MKPSAWPKFAIGLENPKWLQLAITLVWLASILYVTGAANAAALADARTTARARRLDMGISGGLIGTFMKGSSVTGPVRPRRTTVAANAGTAWPDRHGRG